MRRLFATLAVAGAVLAPASPAVATHNGDCGGVVDVQCEGWVCPTDCWRRDCVVWIDPLHDPSTAQCVRRIGP